MTKREEMLMKRISELKRERDEMKKTLKVICRYFRSGVDNYYGIKYITMETHFDVDSDFAVINKAMEEYK